MSRRASLKGKGVEIFYPNGEEAEAAPTEAAPAPSEEAATRKPAPRRTRRAPKPQPPAEARAAAASPVKTPTAVITSPLPATPVVKTPTSVRAAMPALPAERVRPTPTALRTPPPATTRAAAPASPPPEPAELTTSARYDYLAREIDELYEIAARKMAAGRGVGQSMQWLSEARQLVLTGKSSDFAKAELQVRQVSGILKHGDEIDSLYDDVGEQVGDNPDLTEQCMGWLHEARQKIMTGELDDLIGAEFLMEKVKSVLARVEKSRQGANSWPTRILWFWLAGWLILLLALFIADKPLAEALYRSGLAPSGSVPPFSLTQYMLPWLCLVWGAVGSVFDTLIAINEHIAKRSYDSHYLGQGFASPLYGAILGILIYFLFTGGVVAVGTGVAFSSLGGTTSTADVQTTANTASRSLALWVMAFLGGFFHNRTFDLLGKIFDQILITLKILPEPPKEEEQPPSPPVERGAPSPPVPPEAKPPTPPAEPPATPPVSPPPATPPATPPGPPEGPPPGMGDL